MFPAFTLNGFLVPAWLYVIDVAPSFSGTVSGLTNGISSITGFVVPFVAAAFVAEDPADPARHKFNFKHRFIL